MHAPTNWIVTADERRATLYACRKTPGGRWRLEQDRGIENRWERSHEHHRPSLLGRGLGPVPSAAPYGVAGFGHEAEEEQRRFAREVRKWLAQVTKETGRGAITLFTPPRFLGMLREQLGRAGPALDIREAELTHLRPHELAEHAAVNRALESQARAALAMRS